MLLKLWHQTVYRYSSEARDSHNELRLAPLTDDSQTALWHHIEIEPRVTVDSFPSAGGLVHAFNVREPHRLLAITLTAAVRTRLENPFILLDGSSLDWSCYEPERMARLHAERLASTPYVRLSDRARSLAEEVRRQAGSSPVEFILGAKEKVSDILAYDRDVTHVHTDSDQALELRQGVCQDFAHVMLAVLRCAGIPCRYVSGYIYNGEHDQLRGDQAMHAWVDALLPGGAWLGVDPTNDILANDHHVRVHVGADYSEVTPTKGIYWGVPSGPPEVKVSLSRMTEGASEASWPPPEAAAPARWIGDARACQ